VKITKEIIIIFQSFTVLFLPQVAKSQILHPVKWSYAVKKLSNRNAVIFVKATIETGWHIYSVDQKDGGPVKTSFSYLPSKTYRLIDSVQEPSPIIKYEKAFDMDVHYFEKSVIFRQKIALTSSDAVVSGRVSFMVCNAQKCLPPDEFEFRIKVK
jgi:hypothetical protein